MLVVDYGKGVFTVKAMGVYFANTCNPKESRLISNACRLIPSGGSINYSCEALN